MLAYLITQQPGKHVRTFLLAIVHCFEQHPELEGVLRDERTRWGIKILLEVPRSCSTKY